MHFDIIKDFPPTDVQLDSLKGLKKTLRISSCVSVGGKTLIILYFSL